MDIRIGVPVVAEDGEAGRVARIILHPDTHELEGIVAEQGGVLTSDVVIPVDRILAAGEETLRVRGTVAEIDDLEPFAQSQYVAPPDEWIPPDAGPSSVYLFPSSPLAVGMFKPPSGQPLPPEHEVEDLELGDVEVSDSTDVFCGETLVGTIDRVLTEGDSDKVSHLVVLRGVLNTRDIPVPVQHIGRIGPEGVVLTLTEDELDSLPDLEYE